MMFTITLDEALVGQLRQQAAAPQQKPRRMQVERHDHANDHSRSLG